MKRDPIDPNGYPELVLGAFVRYNGTSGAIKAGETAIIVRRSAEGLMRNSWARVGLVGRNSEAIMHVPACSVELVAELDWKVRA